MENDFLKKNISVSVGEENEIVSTKANTLKALSTRIVHGKIEEMNIVIVGDYLENKNVIAEEIKNQFGGSKIVVRSSSTNEDCFKKSNAGHYVSVLDVDSSDISAIINAIEMVLDSYRTDMDVIDFEQILIQHQAVDVVYSGVLLPMIFRESDHIIL